MGAEFEELIKDTTKDGRAKIIACYGGPDFSGPTLEEDDAWYEERSNDAPDLPPDDEPF